MTIKLICGNGNIEVVNGLYDTLSNCQVAPGEWGIVEQKPDEWSQIIDQCPGIKELQIWIESHCLRGTDAYLLVTSETGTGTGYKLMYISCLIITFSSDTNYCNLDFFLLENLISR